MLLPIIILLNSLLFLEMKPEPAKGIDELVMLLALAETERSIFHHKITTHQCLQHLGKITIGIQTGTLGYLLTGLEHIGFEDEHDNNAVNNNNDIKTNISDLKHFPM